VIESAIHIATNFRLLLQGKDGFRTEGEHGAVWISGHPDPFGNLAIVGPESADEIADELSRLPVPSMIMTIGGHPADASRLAELGFESHGLMPAMSVDLKQITSVPIPDGHRIEEIDASLSDEWIEIVGSVFQVMPVVTEALSPRAGSDAHRYYLAYHGKEPVAASCSCLADGIAGIYCVATVEGHRGKGLGALVTAQPLLDALAEGYETGVLQASAMGYSVYEKLGFKTVSGLGFYIRVPA